MVQYNFDEIIDRRDTGSVKWHYSDDTIPLWVADMDFAAPPPVIDAVLAKAPAPVPADGVPVGEKGLVSAADPRAAEAGVDMLRLGGTATDAAIATMAAVTTNSATSSGHTKRRYVS